MFRSLEISRFRGFASIRADGLRRVNLFVGRNGTGKTTILEAVFTLFAGHSADVPLRLNYFRGLPAVAVDSLETWGWLFFAKQTQGECTLRAFADDGREFQLVIEHQLGESIVTVGNGKDGESKTSIVRPTGSTEAIHPVLKFTFTPPDGNAYSTEAVFLGDRVQLKPAILQQLPTSIYIPTVFSDRAIVDAQRFQAIEEDVGREEELLDLLRLVQPSLKKISPYLRGTEPALRADVGLGKLVPVALLGDGLSRLLSIALAIYSAPKGCVLIDEFENGLHYTVLKKVWDAIAEASQRLDVQVFATTHSRECVLSAHEAFKERLEYDFAHYRLEKAKDGSISAVDYDRESLDTSAELNWEIR